MTLLISPQGKNTQKIPKNIAINLRKSISTILKDRPDLLAISRMRKTICSCSKKFKKNTQEKMFTLKVMINNSINYVIAKFLFIY